MRSRTTLWVIEELVREWIVAWAGLVVGIGTASAAYAILVVNQVSEVVQVGLPFLLMLLLFSAILVRFSSTTPLSLHHFPSRIPSWAATLSPEERPLASVGKSRTGAASAPSLVALTNQRIIILRRSLFGQRQESFGWHKIDYVVMERDLQGATLTVSGTGFQISGENRPFRFHGEQFELDVAALLQERADEQTTPWKRLLLPLSDLGTAAEPLVDVPQTLSPDEKGLPHLSELTRHITAEGSGLDVDITVLPAPDDPTLCDVEVAIAKSSRLGDFSGIPVKLVGSSTTETAVTDEFGEVRFKSIVRNQLSLMHIVVDVPEQDGMAKD